MQIINDPSRASSLASSLGSGLNQLAELKLAHLTKKYDQQLERSQFAKTWEPILGQQSANFLSSLNPEERKNAMQNIGSLIQLNEPPSSREQASNLDGGMQQLQGQQQQPQQFDRDYFIRKALGQPDQQDSLLSGLQGSQPQQGQQQPQMQQQTQGQAQHQLTPERTKLIENLLATPQERRERKKLEFAEKTLALKEARAEQVAAEKKKQFNIKETKKYVETLKDKEKASKEGDLRLKKMENLIDKGNLPNAAIWSALSKLEHAPFISGLTAPLAEILKGGVKWYSGNAADIEEFEKLSNEFVKNAKQYFGSRITQKEVELFLQTVPNLMQTDKGKKKIIQNIRSLNELTEIEAKAARSIIRENHGEVPIDIEQQVQDKIGSKLDKVAIKFIAR